MRKVSAKKNTTFAYNPVLKRIFILINWARKPRGSGGRESLVLFLEPRAISKHITHYFLFPGCHKMPLQISLNQSKGETTGKDLRHSSQLSYSEFTRFLPKVSSLILILVGRKRKCLTPHMIVLLWLYINVPFLKAKLVP